MEKQRFSVTIDASREKVWNILWDDDTYPIWTSPFSPTSTVVTDWKKGSKVLFLDGNKQGMVSRVEETIPPEYMSFKHLGAVKDGVEDYDSEETRKWAGALENYTLKNADGKTQLLIDMEISEEFKDMFADLWPKALEKVKDLAEGSATGNSRRSESR